MKLLVVCISLLAVLRLTISLKSDKYKNVTLLYEPADRQLLDFKHEHPVPIGLWTKNAGDPVEIRDINTINTDQMNNQLLLDTLLHFDSERVPERVVHAKGTGAFGYFIVTNDISKYTSADLFNGIGKRTPLVVRFSTAIQSIGGSDIARELKGMSVKFYTNEGNLDFTCLQTPVYFYRDPILFWMLVHASKGNPQTNIIIPTSLYDLMVNNPIFLHTHFFLQADYGIPDGYRKMDVFPIHTYEVSNKHGERHYVRFNFRTEQGFSYLATPRAEQIRGRNPDYFSRDLYNAIEQSNFPAWKLEMDVMSPEDIQKVDYDPFNVARLWKNGTFTTVQIGRLVLNKNVDNIFRDIEQIAFNPANLVPGIPGPPDNLFRGRRLFYRDTQNYRLGRNHNKILVNMPFYTKTFLRDGQPPVNNNGGDAPNYFTNSYNGPVPYVDEKRPWEKLLLLESSAIDLDPLSYFYNEILEDEGHKQRFLDNLILDLTTVTPPTVQKFIKLMYLIEPDMGRRLSEGLEAALAQVKAEHIAQAAVPSPANNNTHIPSWQNVCTKHDKN